MEEPVRYCRFASCPSTAGDPVDTFISEEHSRTVKQVLRRALALFAMLAITTGGWAECAGWQATPEARMACCVDGDSCPMHQSAAPVSDSTAVVSQAEADSCCAASDGDDSTPSSPNAAPTASMATLASPLPLVALPTRTAFELWRALTPLPGTQVPKHLLLSVFLI